MWDLFLCFGDKHPWLLQGVLQGFIAAILVGLLMWWLNTSKDRKQYKNLAGIAARELHINFWIMTDIQNGKCNADKIETSDWNKIRHESACYFSPQIFEKYELFYFTIQTWIQDASTVNLADIAQMKRVMKPILDALVKISGITLPPVNEEFIIKAINTPFQPPYIKRK